MLMHIWIRNNAWQLQSASWYKSKGHWDLSMVSLFTTWFYSQSNHEWPFFFFFWERQPMCTHTHKRGKDRGKGRERISSGLHTQSRALLRAQSHGCEIMPWAEIKSQTLSQLCHPGAPWTTFLKINCVQLSLRKDPTVFHFANVG